MSVVEYDTKFSQLMKYAPHMVVTDNMEAKWVANGLKEYLFRTVPLIRTSTYSDNLDKALRLRHGPKRSKLSENLVRKLRQEDKCLDSLKLFGKE